MAPFLATRFVYVWKNIFLAMMMMPSLMEGYDGITELSVTTGHNNDDDERIWWR